MAANDRRHDTRSDGGENVVLEARDISKHFTVRTEFGRQATVQAVDHVTVALKRGTITGLVGESGSGKTTVARLLARFYPVSSGEVRLHGRSVEARSIRRRDYHRQVQLIFQDPFASLHPMHKVGYNLERALRIHGHATSREQAREQAADVLERVSLTPPGAFLDKRPHELSGGERQRVVIARALAVAPRVLLGDEPISMLDVSIRLDVLNLLARLRDEEGLTLLYITHDIASARYLCDNIQVMYAGQMVEGGPAASVIHRPMHPYTKLLIEASPDPARRANGLAAFPDEEMSGEPPNMTDPPGGCRFHPRCPFVMPECRTSFPPRADLGGGHWSYCWMHHKGRTTELEDA